jgi:hypothetical protein
MEIVVFWKSLELDVFNGLRLIPWSGVKMAIMYIGQPRSLLFFLVFWVQLETQKWPSLSWQAADQGPSIAVSQSVQRIRKRSGWIGRILVDHRTTQPIMARSSRWWPVPTGKRPIRPSENLEVDRWLSQSLVDRSSRWCNVQAIRIDNDE